MDATRILQVTIGSFYVCICRVYSDVFKKIQHMHSYMTVIFYNGRRLNVVVLSLIIDLMHLFVYCKKNTQKENYTKECAYDFFAGSCIVDYTFTVTPIYFNKI